jgi:hypothetical protein
MMMIIIIIMVVIVVAIWNFVLFETVLLKLRISVYRLPRRLPSTLFIFVAATLTDTKSSATCCKSLRREFGSFAHVAGMGYRQRLLPRRLCRDYSLEWETYDAFPHKLSGRNTFEGNALLLITYLLKSAK